jgi:hypothetical protein
MNCLSIRRSSKQLGWLGKALFIGLGCKNGILTIAWDSPANASFRNYSVLDMDFLG